MADNLYFPLSVPRYMDSVRFIFPEVPVDADLVAVQALPFVTRVERGTSGAVIVDVDVKKGAPNTPGRDQDIIMQIFGLKEK